MKMPFVAVSAPVTSDVSRVLAYCAILVGCLRSRQLLTGLETVDCRVVPFGYIVLCGNGWDAAARNGMLLYGLHDDVPGSCIWEASNSVFMNDVSWFFNTAHSWSEDGQGVDRDFWKSRWLPG